MMKISKILMLLSLFIFSNCFSQKNDLNILETWKNTESLNSDGANKYKTKVENGDILIFKDNNIVISNSKKQGKYKIVNNYILILSFNKQKSYYLMNKLDGMPDTIYLTPATAKYQAICDEACASIYEKVIE